jgi:hypothetical protein
MLELKAVRLDERHVVYPLEGGGVRIILRRLGYKDRVIELDGMATMALRVLLVHLDEEQNGRHAG